MHQTLFFIPNEIAGVPVFGLGVLLAVWAVFSIGMIAWLVRRQGWNADTWSYLPILLLLGAIIYWILPVLCEVQGLPIRGYGMMNMIAVIAGAGLAARRAPRIGLDADTIFSLAFWMLVPGIIGARAFYVIEYWPDYVRAYNEPGGGLGALLGGVINISKGGLVVYGAFFGAVVGVLWFVRKYRLSLLPICDLIAPSMALGVAIGRIGCLLNGCCFGGVCDHAWAIQFPVDAPAYYAQVQRGQMHGFLLSGDPRSEPVVLSVRADGAADKAGLRQGDRLNHINGFPISAAGDAMAAVTDAFHRQEPLQIERDDKPAVTIPAVRPIPDHSLPVHPTQVYSVIDGLILCIVLLIWARYCRRDGGVFALLMTLYPISRFYIETLRSDEAPVFGTGMSISQNVSLLLLACAAGLWIYVLRRQPRK